MSATHISVVVSFHNTERYIEACLSSLLSQEYPRDCYEIVMVDNNSTDRSAEIVRRYPTVRLVSESRPGSYVARNRGVLESSGAIIAFTDSDCAPDTDWLQKIAQVMSGPEVCIVQGRRSFACESLGLSILSDYESEKTAYTFSAGTREIYYGYTNNMAVRRAVFDRLGPFFELKRGADVIFVHRVIEEYSCDAVTYAPDVRARHLEVDSVWKWLQKMYVYGQSFQGYSQVAPCRPLSGRERLRVVQATIRRGRYSVPKSVFSILVLSLALVCYELGRWSPVTSFRAITR